MDEPREITDSRALSAMSHPQRRRLLDALTVDGPSPVSALAERVGLAVGSVSHHMKVLAAAQLVVEAPERARDRRERWWRVADQPRRWSTRSFEGDPSAALVADAATSLNLEHHVDKVRAWNARRDEDDTELGDAAFSIDAWVRLAPDELAELSRELIALLDRWRASGENADDGRERAPVFVFAHGVPADP